MARMARVVIQNYPHHVTQRGNRRQKTFFCEIVMDWIALIAINPLDDSFTCQNL